MSRYLGSKSTWRRRKSILAGGLPQHAEIEEPTDLTEAERQRRANREFLRTRDESNTPEFEHERFEGDELLDWAVGNGWE